MNEKQGEHLDQRIRHALSKLPDGPPSGSLFDSARLWEQLRPELATQPAVKKRIGGVWWLAAASVAGLVMGWFWWFGPPSSERIATKQQPARQIDTQNGLIVKSELSLAKSPGLSQQVDRLVVVNKKQKSRRINPTESTKETQPIGPEIATESTTNLVAEISPITPESVSLTSVAAIQKPLGTVSPKRRFRVVHENELMAEEEAYRVRSRANQFVRLGTGGQLSAPDEIIPTLRLPLNRKSTQ